MYHTVSLSPFLLTPSLSSSSLLPHLTSSLPSSSFLLTPHLTSSLPSSSPLPPSSPLLPPSCLLPHPSLPPSLPPHPPPSSSLPPHPLPPHPLSSIEDRLQELEYRRVRLHGHFDHSKELHMWPRALHSEGVASGGFGKQGSEPGAQIVTAFYCQELG